jgi:CPA2 family monovalent cation:H+ antiporter-2
VVLANSEYRHELESDIAPFKGLLLGLFFITVGAAIRFDLLFANAGSIVAMTLGLIALKAAVLYALSRIFGITGSDRWLFTLGLAQAGEFGFVLLSFTVANSVIPAALAQQLLLVVTLSMLLTPLLFIIFDKLIAPRFTASQSREADEIDEKGSVIIAGHGRFGGIVNRILLSAGYKTVVLDYQSEQLEMLRKFGVKVYFGDAMRPDLLHAAGIEEAKMLVIAIDERKNATELVRYVTEKYPHVYVVVRAIDRHHVYELWAAGARDVTARYAPGARHWRHLAFIPMTRSARCGALCLTTNNRCSSWRQSSTSTSRRTRTKSMLRNQSNSSTATNKLCAATVRLSVVVSTAAGCRRHWRTWKPR